MAERLDDVWNTRDYPVLLDLVRRLDVAARPVSAHDLYGTIGELSNDEIQSALHALQRRELIEVSASKALGGPRQVVAILDIAGAAYLMTGLHPDTDDALSGLVEALRQAADRETDEDERSRLRRAADGLMGVSRNVMTGVLTAYLTGQISH